MLENKKTELLRAENLNKIFPGVHAVNDVSMTVYNNEVLGICGENGAGKSTLLKILGGIYKPESGRIFFRGEEVHFNSPQESIRNGISIIHQELSYLNDLSIAENIYQGMLPCKKNGTIDWNKMYADAEKAFAEFDIQVDVRQTMRSLPMAMKQFVEVVKAVSRNASLIIMDEPTSSLGPTDVPKLMKIIRQLITAGKSVIFISHRLEEIFEICDRLVVLCDGQLKAEFERGKFNKMDVITQMVGRTFTQLYPKENVRLGDVRLKIENVSTDRIKNITLQVRAGELVALYGMAGSGQDQILETIFGVGNLKNMTGQIYLDGEPLHVKSPEQAIAKGIGYIPAERKSEGLIACHSVAWNVVLASIKDILKRGKIDYKLQDKIAHKWVKNVAVKTPTIDTLIEGLSGGNQQKVIIAKWLQINPRLLLLNDMTRGVDVGAKYELYRIIMELCKEGISVLFTTSDMMEMMSVADRVYTVWEGTITAEFNRKEMDQTRIMYAAIGKKKEEN